MPSFVPNENSPIYQRSPAVVHLNPAGQYGQPNGKVDDHPLPRHSHSHTSIESFDDEGSSQSTHTSTDDSDIRTRLNGDSQRRHPNMTSSSNGGLDGDVDGINGKLDRMNLNGTSRAEGSDRPARHDITKSGKPHPNGRFPIAIPDRTVPLSNSARPTPDGQTTHDQKGAFSRASLGSANSVSIHPSPTEMSLRPINRGDVRTVENGTATPPAQQTPNGYPFPSSPPAQQRDLAPNSPPSPHRYSSPPLYNPAAPISASTSALALPPVPGIKQRHTLDVPKPSAPRGSKDGFDGTYATGRFSPTGVAGVRRASLSLARRNTRSLHSEMPRDEVVPDDDALRWAEVYREKRASKRRRRDAEDDDRVLVGTKVDETHANWVTAYNMLTGIRVSVSRTNAKLDRPLTDADFQAKQKSTFDIAGNEMIPSAKYDFKFKDYAPWVFRQLRARFQLDPADYLMSLTGKYILSELGSPGKSGSFFYFSRDYKYIIKTIHHAEHKFLRKILKDYYEHVTENPNTLLSQFYGLHRVKMPGPYGKKIHFVVMNNLFPPHRDIHQTYDLKGSTIGRDYKGEDLDNPKATLKDLNWLRRNRHLELGLQKKKLFLEQLQKDVRLLQRLEIMDYSLLVGIHDLQKGNEENLRDKTLRIFNPGGDNSREDPSSVLMRTPSKLENARKARELRQMVKTERPVPMGETSSRMPDELEHNQSRASFVFNQDDGGFRATHEDNTPADEIYYLGVIDCLTHYGIIKKLETFWKGLSSDRNQISALPPHEYGERFINFISGITMSCEEAIRQAQERDAEMQAEAALADQQQQRVGSWSSARNGRSSTSAPPLPSHQPPPLPSGVQSPEAEATVQRAEREAYRTGVSEEDVPSKTLRTTLSPGSVERRDNIASQASILPVVEEAAEGRSSGEQHAHNSRVSNLTGDSEYRPLTPAKDGEERQAGFGNPLLRGHARDHRDHGPPPPTPPKTGYGYGTPQSLKDGADSGYSIGLMNGNGNGNGKSVDLKSSSGSLRSNKGGHQIIGRESLDKALPPLPFGDAQTRPQGVS